MDICCTLTTGNSYLWLIVLAEEHLEESRRTYSRFLSAAERLSLQGKDPEVALQLKNDRLCTFATGNAYPVSLMVAGLTPMVDAIGQSGIDLSIQQKQHGDHFAIAEDIIRRLADSARRPAKHERVNVKARKLASANT